MLDNVKKEDVYEAVTSYTYDTSTSTYQYMAPMNIYQNFYQNFFQQPASYVIKHKNQVFNDYRTFTNRQFTEIPQTTTP
jgi:hypothetical protein